jgi:hypothetical protein
MLQREEGGGGKEEEEEEGGGGGEGGGRKGSDDDEGGGPEVGGARSWCQEGTFRAARGSGWRSGADAGDSQPSESQGGHCGTAQVEEDRGGGERVGEGKGSDDDEGGGPEVGGARSWCQEGTFRAARGSGWRSGADAGGSQPSESQEGGHCGTAQAEGDLEEEGVGLGLGWCGGVGSGSGGGGHGPGFGDAVGSRVWLVWFWVGICGVPAGFFFVFFVVCFFCNFLRLAGWAEDNASCFLKYILAAYLESCELVSLLPTISTDSWSKHKRYRNIKLASAQAARLHAHTVTVSQHRPARY